MTDKNEEKIAELEEKVSELEEALNRVNDDLDHAFSMAGRLEEIIAAWNNRFPDDPIHVPQRRRPESDYALTDKEWKERTRVPHPRDKPKQYNIETGAWE